MKIMLLSLIFSSSVFAAEPTKEMIDLARILFNNPAVAEELKANCTDRLIDYKVSDLAAGIRKFELKFGPSGMCFSYVGLVTIIEDMKPTLADGLPKYQTTVDIRRHR